MQYASYDCRCIKNHVKMIIIVVDLLILKHLNLSLGGGLILMGKNI